MKSRMILNAEYNRNGDVVGINGLRNGDEIIIMEDRRLFGSDYAAGDGLIVKNYNPITGHKIRLYAKNNMRNCTLYSRRFVNAYGHVIVYREKQQKCLFDAT